VLAGREGVPRLMAVHPRLWLEGLAFGAAYAGVFVSGVVTVSTHGAITVRAVSTTSTSLTPYLWHTTVAGTTIMVWPGNVLGDLSPP
jgi:hypothetical protein